MSSGSQGDQILVRNTTSNRVVKGFVVKRDGLRFPFSKKISLLKKTKDSPISADTYNRIRKSFGLCKESEQWSSTLMVPQPGPLKNRIGGQASQDVKQKLQ